MSYPFMDFDEYRRKYPDEYNAYREPTTAAEPELVSEADNLWFAKPPKSAAMIVQEFANKGTNQIGTVDFTELEECSHLTSITTYICRARMMKFAGEGRSRNKKMAKQKACYELIRSAIMMDRYMDFQILAESKEEALKILEKIKPTEEAIEEGQAPVVENYVGQLTEFCVKHKLEPVEFDLLKTSGPSNDITFTVRARVGQNEAIADAKKKKQANAAAAQKLLCLLKEQVEKLQAAKERLEDEGVGLGDGDDDDISVLLSTPGVDVSRAHSEPEPQRALQELMSDATRFQPGFIINYRDLDYPSKAGRTQTLLTVQYSQARPAPCGTSTTTPSDGRNTPTTTSTTKQQKVDKDAPQQHCYVFCGEGAKETTESRDEAARAALVHFYTYKGPKEREGEE